MDMTVNEAREFMENWSLKMSKISSVLLSDALLIKIQSSSLEICRILCAFLESSPSSSSISGVQHCMQQIRCLEQERITEHITEVLGGQQDDIIPSTNLLIEVTESLGLTSNQELLKESVAVEKERMNAQVNQNKGQLAQTNRIVDLISHIRDYMQKIERI
ncbi:hypothetical protein LWI28_008890 [Acer negundo]|uniref:PUB2-4-like N-terminal domain-containing protein n=1 Tax=Acer negundo TaxID=4023 RepID=A0AAD5IZ88_ACENE|nr:hypothetical protein LWI28_008890 [Acer negundo]